MCFREARWGLPFLLSQIFISVQTLGLGDSLAIATSSNTLTRSQKEKNPLFTTRKRLCREGLKTSLNIWSDFY